MEKVTAFKTRGGKLFENFSDVEKYVEVNYGEALTRLAHRFVQIDKYTLMCEEIELSLPMIEKMMELYNDKVDLARMKAEAEQNQFHDDDIE